MVAETTSLYSFTSEVADFIVKTSKTIFDVEITKEKALASIFLQPQQSPLYLRDLLVKQVMGEQWFSLFVKEKIAEFKQGVLNMATIKRGKPVSFELITKIIFESAEEAEEDLKRRFLSGQSSSYVGQHYHEEMFMLDRVNY